MKSDFAERLGNIPRVWKRAILVTFDVAVLAFALWASFSLRFGQWTPPNSIAQFLLIVAAPLVALPIFVRFGLYRAVIRYLPERALWSIVQATSLATLCWVLFVFLFQLTGYTVVPRTVPILYWALSTALIGSSRFAAKQILWSGGRQHQTRPIAIYGAGGAGVQLANALRRQGNERIVGFLDDNPALHGRDVAGIRVFAPASINSLVVEYGVEEVILSIPTLTSARKQEIIARISGQGVRIRTLPPISDLV
ncbi:MAG TPA: polysaccharide biosynthesis protein, partial [Devosia sp.]|nr:polysaccharide biosynthesis protein [Devosia sp.]